MIAASSDRLSSVCMVAPENKDATPDPAVKASDAGPKQQSDTTGTIFYRMNFWVGLSVVLAVILAVVLVADTIVYRHDHENGPGRGASVINNYYYYGSSSHLLPEQPYQPDWSVPPSCQGGPAYCGTGSSGGAVQPSQGGSEQYGGGEQSSQGGNGSQVPNGR